MRKWLNNPWVATLLAVAAVAAVGQTLLQETVRTAPEAAPSEDSAPIPTSEAGDRLPDREALASVLLQGTLREIFPRSAIEATGPESSESKDRTLPFLVSAIWNQGGRSLAVINDRLLEVGQSIEPFTLAAIDHSGVWLQRGEEKTFLAFGKAALLRVSLPSSSR